MRRTLARVGVLVTTGVLVVGGLMSAAGANPVPAQKLNPNDCFAGHFCLWQDSWHSGPLGMYNATSTCYSMGVMNNAASSVVNKDTRVYAYDSSNCTGAYTMFGTGDQVGLLSLSGWNDRISSFKQV